MSEATHTPTPWYTEETEARAHVFAEGIGMDCNVARCFGPNPADVYEIKEIAKANAAFIVRAVNRDQLFGELVSALEDCELYFDGRADAEYFTSSPAPVGNTEMTLLVLVRAVLARVAEQEKA